MNKKEQKKRLIASRKHRLASGKHFFSLKVKDIERNELIININHEGGEIYVNIFDENKMVVALLDNPQTGDYHFTLAPNQKYKVVIKLVNHHGGYSVYF